MLEGHEAHEVKGDRGTHQALIMFTLTEARHHGRLELSVLRDDLVAIIFANRKH
jgi:hypothetical protein